jgi:hypothetical protein
MLDNRNDHVIIYVPRVWNLIGYSEENGQAITDMNFCNFFECQIWQDNVAMAPKLVQNEKGFWYCPKHNKQNGAKRND